MLQELKRLMRETAVYGLSTVVGRLLNLLLLPLYTHALPPAEYGLVATVFSYIAFLTVLYGHGMDFAFMRHCKEEAGEDARRLVFSTALCSLTFWPLLISLALHFSARPLALAAGLPDRLSDVVRYAAWVLAFDAMALVPFAHLRMRHRAGAYAGVKVANIVINLALNYVFLVKMGLGARGVFLASLAASCATLMILMPVMAEEARPRFDWGLYRSMLGFALPLIPAGAASMMVQVIDRPILKALTNDAVVGVYQANYRLGIFMMMVVNMFDAAWRPFFLQRAAQPGAEKVFARVLSYFVAGSAFLFLAVTLLIPAVVALPLGHGRTLIHPAYWGGLALVPVVTLGYLFNGVYVNMLPCVTLAKRSDLVAYAAALGAIVNVGANFLWIPRWGMMGAAWATLAAYAAMALALHLMGRRLYPIPYETNRLAAAAATTVAVLAAARALGLSMEPDRLLARLGLLLAFPLALAALGFLDADERAALRRRLIG